jgi:iron-sulfur cluster assembly protein
MLQLTESARDALRGIVAAEQATPDSGLRIASDGNADGGPGLSMAVAEAPTEGDAVLDQGDVRLFLDSTAAAFLADKVLDAEAHGDHFHFSIDEQEDGAAG